LTFEKLSIESFSSKGWRNRNQFSRNGNIAQFSHQMKATIKQRGFILVNGAISVLFRSRKQRLKVLLFQSNFRRLFVARPAIFPYAGLT
jgi:hypothetical protein